MAASEQLSLDLAPVLTERDTGMRDLPEGWRLLRLDQVCEINPSRKGRTNYPDDLPVSFVPMAAVDEVTGTIAAPETRPFSTVKKGYTWFVENDVLFAKISPCMQNGKAAIARDLSNGVGFGSTEFHVLRPGPAVLPEWIHLFIRQPSFKSAAAQHFTGSVGQQRVPEAFLTTQVVPVPPLSEQRRIVTRIKELAAKIERARGLRREAIQELRGAFRYLNGTVFDFQGDSVIGNFATIQSGYAFKSGWFSDEGIRLVRNVNIGHGRIEWSEVARLPLSRRPEFSRFELSVGDILIALDRPIISTGVKVALVSAQDTPSLLLQRVGRVRFLNDSVIPEFFYTWLQSDKFASAINPGRSNGIPHISPKDVELIPFAVPPLSEQRRIVSYLRNVQARVDVLKQRQGETATELDALLPTVLARAFRGEL